MNGVCAIINETQKRVLFFKKGASGTERMGKAVSFWDKNKKLILEFLRYAVVGGVSAVVDMAVNYLMLYVVLQGTKDDHGLVAVSVAVVRFWAASSFWAVRSAIWPSSSDALADLFFSV